jgi:hypothetical protein
LAQEKPFGPGFGPKATPGSPSETSPFSKYHGNVPIGPTPGWQGESVFPGAPWQLRALHPVYVGWVQLWPLSKEK